MQIRDISSEQLHEYSTIVEEYLTKTRGWSKEAYKLTFGWVEVDLNVAVFHVIPHEAKAELALLRKPNMSMTHPLEATILVDIVDRKVLSENEPDTVFPNRIK